MSRVIRISETSKQKLEKHFPGEKSWDAKLSSLLDAARPIDKEAPKDVAVQDFIELFEYFPDVNDSRCTKPQIFDHISEWYWEKAHPLLMKAKK